MPIKGRKKYIAAKIETTKGTAIAVGGTQGKILAFDPVMDQDIEFEDRMPAGISMGSLAGVPGAYAGRFRARVELRGSGTAGTLPLWASTLLVACGNNNTNVAATSDTIAPVSSISDEKTVTIALWEDGVQKKIIGAKGNAVFSGEFGKRLFVEFDFRGVWVANPTITHETTLPRRFAGATCQLGGAYNLPISRFRFDLGNQIELRPDVTQDSALSYAYNAARKPTISFDPEHVTVATYDLFGKQLASTTAALVITVGSVAGNIITINAPRVQFIDPKTADRQGLLTHEVNCQLNAEAGDDEYSIVFT